MLTAEEAAANSGRASTGALFADRRRERSSGQPLAAGEPGCCLEVEQPRRNFCNLTSAALVGAAHKWHPSASHHHPLHASCPHQRMPATDACTPAHQVSGRRARDPAATPATACPGETAACRTQQVTPRSGRMHCASCYASSCCPVQPCGWSATYSSSFWPNPKQVWPPQARFTGIQQGSHAASCGKLQHSCDWLALR